MDQLEPERITHLERIRDRGVLRVVTEYNSISYFIYRGQPMGFQYEMLQELANYLDLSLEVSVSNDLERNFSDLQEGNTDMIAMNLTVTSQTEIGSIFYGPFASDQAGAGSAETASGRR